MTRATIVLLTLGATSALAQNRYYDDRTTGAFPAMPLAIGDWAASHRPLLRSTVEGWALEGSGYELRCDEVTSSCAIPILRSRSLDTQKGAGRLVHREPAMVWRGATVGARAQLKAGQVARGATLALRAEDASGKVVGEAVSAKLTGTTGFSWHSIFLTVPQTAERLVLSIELDGQGALFIRAIELDDAEVLALAR